MFPVLRRVVRSLGSVACLALLVSGCTGGPGSTPVPASSGVGGSTASTPSRPDEAAVKAILADYDQRNQAAIQDPTAVRWADADAGYVLRADAVVAAADAAQAKRTGKKPTPPRPTTELLHVYGYAQQGDQQVLMLAVKFGEKKKVTRLTVMTSTTGGPWLKVALSAMPKDGVPEPSDQPQEVSMSSPDAQAVLTYRQKGTRPPTVGLGSPFVTYWSVLDVDKANAKHFELDRSCGLSEEDERTGSGGYPSRTGRSRWSSPSAPTRSRSSTRTSG